MDQYTHRIDFFENRDCREREQLIGRLSSGCLVRLDEYQLLSSLFRRLPSRASDLLRIALAVYAVDRLAPRDWRRNSGGNRWLKVDIDVAEPDFWKESDTMDLLIQVLELLGDDTWEIRFHSSGGKQTQGFLFAPASSGFGCLYSGGLDSAAGLATQLRATSQPVIPIAVYHQAGQRDRVESQIKRLRDQYGIDLERPVIVRTSLVGPPSLREQEPSQRCRSFLFAAFGALVACAEGLSEVQVYETGVGALNLPLLLGMATGAHTTRSSHPGFLRLMSRLTSRVAERPIGFALPHHGRTKAELVQTLAQDGLMDVAFSTVSCVHYPVRHKAKQCGCCPACLGRRQAIITAGIQEPDGKYQWDLFGPHDRANAVPPAKLTYLRATLIHLDRLAAICHDPLPEWFRQYMLGTRAEEDEARLHRWVGVLLRYRTEWSNLIVQGQVAGWNWARWFAHDAAA